MVTLAQIQRGELSPHDILIETDDFGTPVNPRGPIRDTTDLQDSIREAGRIIEPLLLRVDEDGRFWVVNGHRRLVAARAIGLAAVPYVVVNPTAHADSIDMMLASNVHQAFPPVVLAGDGTVIGGVAKAVGDRLRDGRRTRESLARLMGVRPDAVSAYERLLVAPVDVRRAVASGRLSLTAFARMKHAPADVQSEIVAAVDGEAAVTVNAVRDGLREARQRRQPQLAELPEEKPVIERLNGMLADLRQILEQPLSPREQVLIRQIHTLTK